MKVTEPMTMITDYALAAFVLFWGSTYIFWGGVTGKMFKWFGESVF